MLTLSIYSIIITIRKWCMCIAIWNIFNHKHYIYIHGLKHRITNDFRSFLIPQLCNSHKSLRVTFGISLLNKNVFIVEKTSKTEVMFWQTGTIAYSIFTRKLHLHPFVTMPAHLMLSEDSQKTVTISSNKNAQKVSHARVEAIMCSVHTVRL